VANRFTQFSAKEFQDTIDPLPIGAMMQMGQINQGRNDAMNIALGKAEAGLGLNAGYATQGEYANKVEQDYQTKFNAISDAYATDGNYRAAARGLSKFSQERAADPRIKLIQSDYDTKKFVDDRINAKGYGVSSRFGAHDDKTGQWNVGDLEAMAGRNEMITGAHYNFQENVSDLKTYSPYIEKIKPIIDDQYTLVNNPETGKPEYRHKQTDKILDYEGVKNHSIKFLSSFRNDDGTINMEALTALDPEMAQNAAWKMESLKREGREGQYKWDSLFDNYMNIAELSFFTEGKQNLTGAGADGSSEYGQESSIPLRPIGEIDYNVVNATNTPAGEITNIANMSKAIGTNALTGIDSETGYSLNDMSYAPSRTFNPQERRDYDTTFIEKQRNIYASTFDVIHNKLKENNKPVQMPDGNWQYKTEPSEVEEQARQDTDAMLLKRRKASKSTNDAALKTLSEGDEVPTEEKIKEELNKLTPGIRAVYDATIDYKNLLDETKDFTDKHGGFYISEKSNGISYKKWAEETTRLSDEMDRASRVKLVKHKLRDDFIIQNDQLIPKKYEKYYSNLNEAIESNFGQEEFTTTGYLLTKTDGDLTSKEIPMSHKIINDAAIARMQGGTGVYYKGSPLNAMTQPDGEDGQNIKSLYVAGTDNDTHDFSNGNYVPRSFYFDNINDKWMVRGLFSTTKDGEIIKSSEYDVDVTDNMRQFMTNPQMKEVIATDRAVDIIEGTYKGTSTVAKFGRPDDVTGSYGDIVVSVTPTGSYSISGKVFDPEKGTVRSITEMLVEAGENPLKMNKVDAKEHLSSIFKNQMYYGEQEKVGTTSLNIPKEFKADVDYAFNTIGNYESEGNTGEYNAMNQGGADEGREVFNGGNSYNIIGKRVVDMTISDVMKRQNIPKDSKDSGDRIHAVGKFQFTKDTFKEYADKLNIPYDSKVTPEVQQRMALELIKDEAKRTTSRSKLKERLKIRWVGLEKASDAELEKLIDSAFAIGNNL